MPDSFVPLIYAHRGASTRAPANTVEAFRLAAVLGADGVELDVRLTADGVLVVHHDARLQDGRPVGSLDRRDLPASVATLDEAIDACGDLRLNVEIKSHRRESGFDAQRRAGPMVAAVLARRGVGHRSIVSSFDLGMVDAVAAAGPAVRTAWLVGLGLRRSLLDRCARHGHDAVHPNHTTVSAAFVVAAHSRGLLVNTWTVDDAARLRTLAAWGVDGVITNDVETALEAFDPA